MKIDWKRKLTSRKLWVSVAGFVAGLIIIFGGSQENADKVSGAILSGAAVVGYVLGEGLADTRSEGQSQNGARTRRTEDCHSDGGNKGGGADE